MILETRYINNNFEDSNNKIYNYLGRFDYFVEMNTKFLTMYKESYKKQFLGDLKKFYILSDILYIYMCVATFMANDSFMKHWFIPVIYILFAIAWVIFQIHHLGAYTLGNKEDLIETKQSVTFKEYIRYHELSIPIETIPDWIANTDNVYSDESFDKIINRLTKDTKIVKFLSKYKKLAFKTNAIIDNNKKILTSWLAEEKKQLVIVGIKPITLFDYKSEWREEGYSEEDIEYMYEQKMKELKGEPE